MASSNSAAARGSVVVAAMASVARASAASVTPARRRSALLPASGTPVRPGLAHADVANAAMGTSKAGVTPPAVHAPRVIPMSSAYFPTHQREDPAKAGEGVALPPQRALADEGKAADAADARAAGAMGVAEATKAAGQTTGGARCLRLPRPLGPAP